MIRLNKLTDWKSGESMYIDLTTIISIYRITPSVEEGKDGPVELGGRTRVATILGEVYLVREMPDEIYTKMNPYSFLKEIFANKHIVPENT